MSARDLYLKQYLKCPDCGKKRVTKRDFSDGAGYACDAKDCYFSLYIEEEGDQFGLIALQSENPDVEVQFKHYPDAEEGQRMVSHYIEENLWEGWLLASAVERDEFDVPRGSSRWAVATLLANIVGAWARQGWVESDLTIPFESQELATRYLEQYVREHEEEAMCSSRPYRGRAFAVIMPTLIDLGLDADLTRVVNDQQHMAFGGHEGVR